MVLRIRSHFTNKLLKKFNNLIFSTFRVNFLHAIILDLLDHLDPAFLLSYSRNEYADVGVSVGAVKLVLIPSEYFFALWCSIFV